MSAIRLFRIGGIDVKAHYSLLIILLFLTWVFSVQSYPYGFRGHENALLLSALASLSLFISVFLHEFGHSIVSRKMGYGVKEIILFIFGGIAVLERQPKGMKEVVVSVSGPAVSVAIAAVFYVLSTTGIPNLSEFSVVLYRINLIIAAFNLLPAFPLDGGRVLRGLMAERVGYERATFIAAEIGKAFAVFMAVFGIVYNLWLTLIAIFIYLGANEEEKLSRIEAILGRLRVRDIMTSEVKVVHPDMSVEEFIEFVFRNKHLGYPVVENGRIVGIVTLHDVTGKDRGLRIRDVMSREVVTLSPDDPAMAAFRIMNERGLGRIPVVEGERVVGIVSKTDLVRLMQIQEVLRVG